RDEFAGRERLDEVIVRAELEAKDAIDLVLPCSEEEDGHRTAGADLAANIEAVAGAGKADVEDDDPGVLLTEDLEALLAVRSQQDAVALTTEIQVDQVGDVRIVFDDDHRPVLRAHTPKPRISRCRIRLEP